MAAWRDWRSIFMLVLARLDLAERLAVEARLVVGGEDLAGDLRFPDELELEAPMLGEHNHAVLEKYLGYAPERVRQLAEDAVLHSAPY